MNINLPLPKQKKYSRNQATDPFPVQSIPENFGEEQFVGHFTGMNVEITDEESIKKLYQNGCFGIGTLTKTCPRICFNEPRIQTITQQQYEQKLKWRDRFENKNPKTVMVRVLPEGQQYGEANDSSELNLVEDPFPIEEALALQLEEAFFLHTALKCLRIMNFDETNEFTTDELIQKFCNLNPKFIERYVAYQYYRSKNWVVKCGIKFGGDYLLYHKGPEFTHASYVVLVSDNEVNQNNLDVQSNYRVSDTTGKGLIILKVTRPDGLEYSNYFECFNRLSEFKVTEIIPKRFQSKQLTTQNS